MSRRMLGAGFRNGVCDAGLGLGYNAQGKVSCLSVQASGSWGAERGGLWPHRDYKGIW